jgi:hypothetical protein
MILLPALILAQSVFTYADAKGDLSVRAKDGQGEMLKDGYKFELRGDVNISSRKRKFTLAAPQVTAVVGKSNGAKSPDELRTAKASGGVRLTQAAQVRTSNLQARNATYTIKGSSAMVQANGSVRIQNVDSQKSETMIATGSSASAILDPKSKRGIDKATLNGPVRIEIVQSKGDRSRVVFTGNKLVLYKDTVTLTGNVKATGTGASQLGSFSNLQSVMVFLNDKGEMSHFKWNTGGGR